MIIFYNKDTGEIIASFQEIYTLKKNILVTKESLPPSQFKRLILNPIDSQPFENPRNPKNIHDYYVKGNKLVKFK